MITFQKVHFTFRAPPASPRSSPAVRGPMHDPSLHTDRYPRTAPASQNRAGKAVPEHLLRSSHSCAAGNARAGTRGWSN